MCHIGCQEIGFLPLSQMHIRIPQFIRIIPGQCEHTHPQPIKLLQSGQFPLTDAPLFYRKKSGHFPCLPVLFYVRTGTHRSNPFFPFLHLPFKQRRHLKYRFKRLSGLLQIDKQCKILQRITGVSHFFQIDMSGISSQILTILIQSADRITMHIHNSHSFPPLFTKAFSRKIH